MAPGTFYACASCRTALCARCAGRPDTGMPELYTCPSCAAPAVPTAHLPEWRRLLMGADRLEDLRLRASTTDTYRSSLRDYCSFCTARGATPLPATLGLLRGYIYHCTSDRSLAPSTIAGRLAAISDWHRRQLPHLRLAGRSTLNPCKDESINTLISILERRTVRPAKGRLPLRIPDLRAMLHRGFPLSSAFGRHQHLCLP